VGNPSLSGEGDIFRIEQAGFPTRSKGTETIYKEPTICIDTLRGTTKQHITPYFYAQTSVKSIQRTLHYSGIVSFTQRISCTIK
jgi:hypothetical protein